MTFQILSIEALFPVKNLLSGEGGARSPGPSGAAAGRRQGQKGQKGLKFGQLTFQMQVCQSKCLYKRVQVNWRSISDMFSPKIQPIIIDLPSIKLFFEGNHGKMDIDSTGDI